MKNLKPREPSSKRARAFAVGIVGVIGALAVPSDEAPAEAPMAPIETALTQMLKSTIEAPDMKAAPADPDKRKCIPRREPRVSQGAWASGWRAPWTSH